MTGKLLAGQRMLSATAAEYKRLTPQPTSLTMTCHQGAGGGQGPLCSCAGRAQAAAHPVLVCTIALAYPWEMPRRRPASGRAHRSAGRRDRVVADALGAVLERQQPETDLGAARLK